MAAQTLKLFGRQYVLMPKREYDRMQAELERQARQGRDDVAAARRRIRSEINEKLYEAIGTGRSTPMTARDWDKLRSRIRKPRRRCRAG